MKSKLTLLLLLIILVISGCGQEADSTTANYKDLEMARLEGEETIYTDTFTADTPEIYVTGVLENASETTNIKSEWYYVEDGEEFIDSAELEVEDEMTEFNFSLSIPDAGWPEGTYEARLFIDDEQQEALQFEIEGAKSSFKDMTMARVEDEQPIYTDTFATDTPEIYVTGAIEGVSGSIITKAEWYYTENAEEFIDSVEFEVEENTDLFFSLSIPDQGWPEGTYEVRLFIEGELQETLEFEVAGSKANYKDLRMAKSEGEEPVYTDTFSIDTPEIYATGVIENVSGTTKTKAEWYYTENGEEFIDSAELEVEENTDFYFSLSSPDDGWPEGSYEVRLFINDEHKETLEFNIE